jgi:hypothetical protein
MKRNTGCGCNDNHKEDCPRGLQCDKVDSKSGECNVDNFTLSGELEQRVVLADLLVQIPVEADIKLPTFANDIKQIKKNVKLTQCKVIRDAFSPDNLTAKLFIQGFVHKNIQYVEDCFGCLKDFSVNVPFKCFQRVRLTQPALFPFGEFSSKSSNLFERRELAKDGHGADDCVIGSRHLEVFTEPIQCKLLFSAIDEWDFLTNHDNWGRFNKITEKMDIVLGIKLFQLQQEPTPIPTPTGGLFAQSETILDRFRGIIGG